LKSSQRRDSVLTQIDIGSIQAFALKEKDLRKIQSDRNMRLLIGEAECKADVLNRQDQKHIETMTTKDLRKVQSDQQLQRASLKSTDSFNSFAAANNDIQDLTSHSQNYAVQ